MLVFLFSLVAACEFKTSFTECSEGTRAVLNSSVDCPSNFSVVAGLSCDFECPGGRRLNFNNGKLHCSECPEGSYSIGGGDEYSSWIQFEDYFHAYCFVLIDGVWELSGLCKSWHANSDSYLTAGSGVIDQWYESDLTFYPVLVKSGFLEVQYRKESGKQPGYEVGDFYIFIDEYLSFFDFERETYSWSRVRLPLGPGVHKVQIVFDKYTTVDSSNALIKKIVITGTKFANLDCTPCKHGHSPKGADTCYVCEIGSYFDLTDGLCMKCDPGFSSHPDAIGKDSCFKLTPCTEANWHYYYSECIGGWQKKVYEWNTPLNCDNSNVLLPNPESVSCIPCGTGKIYGVDKCHYCPTGTFNPTGDFGSNCTNCGVGKYAPKVSDFVHWTSFPEEFKGLCMDSSESCTFDWELRGTYITTSPIYKKNSLIIYQGSFEITENLASIEFKFKVRGNSTRFSFSVNGKLVKAVIGEEEGTFLYNLNKDLHFFRWACYHSDSSDDESCEIHRITIDGTRFGGAGRCIDCPVGYVSVNLTDQCDECGAGFTSNLEKTQCVRCPEGEYVDTEKVCQKCNENLRSEGGYCVGDQLIVSNSTFDLKNFTGQAGSASSYCSEDKLKMYCYETFYGPVRGHPHYFYLSVLNPFKVEMPSYNQIFNDHAYAFGIIDTDDLPIHQSIIKNPEEGCNTSHSQVVVNLGREVNEISHHISNNISGFKLKYSHGDYCNSTHRFSTEIIFLCSKDDLEGWPVFVKHDECVFYFLWPTVHGCEICKPGQNVVHEEDCEEGQRVSHVFEGEGCIFRDRKSHVEVVGKCSKSVFGAWPFVLSMVLCGIMFVVVIVLVVLAYNKRNKYIKLTEIKFQNIEQK